MVLSHTETNDSATCASPAARWISALKLTLIAMLVAFGLTMLCACGQNEPEPEPAPEPDPSEQEEEVDTDKLELGKTYDQFDLDVDGKNDTLLLSTDMENYEGDLTIIANGKVLHANEYKLDWEYGIFKLLEMEDGTCYLWCSAPNHKDGGFDGKLFNMTAGSIDDVVSNKANTSEDVRLTKVDGNNLTFKYSIYDNKLYKLFHFKKTYKHIDGNHNADLKRVSKTGTSVTNQVHQKWLKAGKTYALYTSATSPTSIGSIARHSKFKINEIYTNGSKTRYLVETKGGARGWIQANLRTGLAH